MIVILTCKFPDFSIFLIFLIFKPNIQSQKYIMSLVTSPFDNSFVGIYHIHNFSFMHFCWETNIHLLRYSAKVIYKRYFASCCLRNKMQWKPHNTQSQGNVKLHVGLYVAWKTYYLLLTSSSWLEGAAYKSRFNYDK